MAAAADKRRKEAKSHLRVKKNYNVSAVRSSERVFVLVPASVRNIRSSSHAATNCERVCVFQTRSEQITTAAVENTNQSSSASGEWDPTKVRVWCNEYLVCCMSSHGVLKKDRLPHACPLVFELAITRPTSPAEPLDELPSS